MNIRGLRKFHAKTKGVYAPCLILLALFVLTYFSEATFSTGFEGYNVIISRSYFFVPNSSDMSVILNNLKINTSSQEVQYSFYIQAWLDINLTQIDCLLQTSYSQYTFSMTNGERASYNSTSGEAWGWFYQIENPLLINESLNGFSQKYPYDYYSLSFSLRFFTSGLQPTFNETFQPNVFLPIEYGWKTGTFSKPVSFDNYGFTLDIGIVVARDTLLAVLQYMIPTLAIYVLMGFSLFTGSFEKLKDRINLFLTTAVLTLAFYTFLLGQIGLTPLFVQSLTISLIVANVILLVFSIISCSENGSSTRWDVIGMILASITPIAYLLISTYNLATPLLQRIVANPLWILQNVFLAYIDYRFLLWLILFQLAFWSAYLWKQKVIARTTLLTGLGILILNGLPKFGVFDDFVITFIGIVLVVVPMVWILLVWIHRPVKKNPQPWNSKYWV